MGIEEVLSKQDLEANIELLNEEFLKYSTDEKLKEKVSAIYHGYLMLQAEHLRRFGEIHADRNI